MRIINPSFALQPQLAAANRSDDRAPVDWSKDPIAIISYSKANAQALLEGLKGLMGDFRPTDNIDYLYKNSAARPAPPELIDQVAKNYRGAILALAD